MIKFDYINYDEIFTFLSQYSKIYDEELITMKNYAFEKNVPIVKDDVANFLYFIVSILKPKNILEIGTAIGYSSILMAKASNYKSNIITIESSKDMYDIALENYSKFNVNNVIIKLGKAQEILGNINNKFDFVFLDASKSHYLEFYRLIKKLLSDNYILVADNVLFKGLICANEENVPKRYKTIYKNMKEFIKYIFNETDSMILPIGDGLLISKSKK